jgi:itaconate CoA-transferase
MEVHYVVSEFGAAQLKGKSTGERARALIGLAHPKFRDWLTDEAKKLGYL